MLLSERAKNALADSDVIIGYKTYIRLIKNLVAKKEVSAYGMREEIERAGYAIEKAKEGRKVAIISGGDAGIYGMAGPVLEILGKNEDVNIEIIPGIPALIAASSLLGAPLMNDFTVVSLSDLLTDIKTIENRVLSACKGDFVIVFYNPSSQKRHLPLQKAWEIVSNHRKPDTPVGIVRNAYRNNEEIKITTLKNMLNEHIDMLTIIIIGNSKTYIKGRFMITPRGYLEPFGKLV